MEPISHRETVNALIAVLKDSKQRFTRLSLDDRIRILQECLEGVYEVSREWVELACEAKGIPLDSPARAEEVSAGPVTTARYLRLLMRTLEQMRDSGEVPLPGRPRQTWEGCFEVPLLPERTLFDSLVFYGFRAVARMNRAVHPAILDQHLAPQYRGNHPREGTVCLVLGAGNVSSIPATDTLSKLFIENRCVLLKMNPMNDYLGPLFEKAFGVLIREGLLRIFYGGAEAGSAAVYHPDIDTIHITGSVRTFDRIVWGPSGSPSQTQETTKEPVLKKPITSELGNVTPWIVVPGRYSGRQLRFQAENVASSITNNASFNCIATKVLLTCRDWSQREEFLDCLETVLRRTPPRRAYYPGAPDRFRRFAGGDASGCEEGTLPWVLLRNFDPKGPQHYFREESFVCVCVEVPLEADTSREFLRKASDFADENLWGTLAASITLPPSFRKIAENEKVFQECLQSLRYGTVAVNHWSGLAFALGTLPWGGYPGRPLWDIQSGDGWVHNSYMLEGIEKCILEGPLTLFPKPIWFPTHPRPEPVAWKLLDLYHRPGSPNLARLILSSVL